MQNSSNLLNINYRNAASSFRKFTKHIIDCHTHVHGSRASKLFGEIATAYGIGTVYSMTLLEDVEVVQSRLPEMIRFISIPNFAGKDRLTEFGEAYIERLAVYKTYGAKVAKFWNAPRIYDAAPEPFASSPFLLNSPARLKVMERAVELGMIFMVHAGDPDTWFKTKYIDSKKYGTKPEQYGPLEDVLERFKVPTIAAHMGGNPENLDFLSKLLEKHSNLYLDISATKWMVRELSKHSRQDFVGFLSRWKERILFGSDIVTSEAHLSNEASTEMAAKASSESEAYDLYASRYWALRTLLETDYDGQSPIADPDLQLVEPEKFGPNDAPRLRGFDVPDEILEYIYFKNAERVIPGA